MNMDEIAKALSNNRSLYVLRSRLRSPSLMMLSDRNAENATLFYDIENERLTLYDVTSTSICVVPLRRTHSFPLDLAPSALCTLAMLNPNLTNLRLDFCGCMDDTVATACVGLAAKLSGAMTNRPTFGGSQCAVTAARLYFS